MSSFLSIFPGFDLWQFLACAAIFCWSGFVRTGLGFGGAALGLPFMLFLYDQPVFWIPVIGSHLLFFSALTLSNRLHNVDWRYLGRAGRLILPAAFAGVFGLLNLPNEVLLGCIYGLTLLYALMWALDRTIESSRPWVDNLLLLLGGYVSGSSLTGAPLMIAVFMRHVPLRQLRDTLFVLWFIIVAFKMGTLTALAVPLHLDVALALVPPATVGHWIGLRTHEVLLRHDRLSKRLIGLLLLVVSMQGLWSLM